ncbi:PPOX class F420-dependent oxidoreductase [Streptomyces sp. NBC_01803]|uniref:PPOX class F420-dependent oxidoreductase n=1 Tax=Streptomyces sp. NBC_01803 TaxID=2975946 RepID=UPI002DD7BDF5|nr:PPOX class F420-dependent oxidoreductase [Streptomyces sp. NBC_01803]WSA43141.1 PPOX class F420-dependent oxidoreductase [Streptomyces sp. NBC_01803]
MSLTSAEQDLVAKEQPGRLATVAPEGSPQNKPAGFRYDAGLGGIHIYGFGRETSATYRDIQVNPRVSFVIDGTVPGAEGAAGVRFLEIRGHAEPAADPAGPDGHQSRHFIRVRPRRMISWNVDPAEPGMRSRDV